MELFLLSQSLASNPKASNLRTKVDYYPFSHLKKKKRFLDTFPQALLRGGQIGFFHYQVHQPTPAWRGWRCKRDFSQKVLVGRGAIDVFSCLLLGCFLTLSHSLSHTHTLSLFLTHIQTLSLSHTHAHTHTLLEPREQSPEKSFLRDWNYLPKKCLLSPEPPEGYLGVGLQRRLGQTWHIDKYQEALGSVCEERYWWLPLLEKSEERRLAGGN